AVISADALSTAGFDNLAIGGSDIIQFDGNVTLRAGQSIKFLNAALSDTLTTGHVGIDAPYVFFAGHQTIRNDGSPAGFLELWKGSSANTQAQFSVNAKLIDFQYDTYFGASGSLGGANYDFLGFKDVVFTSAGDVRFLNTVGTSGSPPPGTRIFTPGNITF